MRRVGILSVLVVLFFTSQVFAGWVIEQVEEGEASLVQLQNNKIKVVMESEVMIFDVVAGTFHVMVPAQKIYTGGKASDLGSGAQAAAQQMQEEYLKRMPPEQQEQYRKYMEQMKAQEAAAAGQKLEVEVKKTSEKATVAGYATQKYEVWVNGELAEEAWISSKIRIADEIDMDKFYQMQEAMRGGRGEPSYESSPQYIEMMKQGYALRRIEYEDGEEEVTEVTKVENKRIPDSEFAVPDGYRKVDMRQFHEMREAMEEQYDSQEDYGYEEIEED